MEDELRVDIPRHLRAGLDDLPDRLHERIRAHGRFLAANPQLHKRRPDDEQYEGPPPYESTFRVRVASERWVIYMGYVVDYTARVVLVTDLDWDEPPKRPADSPRR